ncbi:MAG: GAF domain-containing sensor histidine kinase [Chloroflexi bacterium]|nr:GAF domain-containing sensor histidine kinase [Chloroflexota bacterium]
MSLNKETKHVEEATLSPQDTALKYIRSTRSLWLLLGCLFVAIVISVWLVQAVAFTLASMGIVLSIIGIASSGRLSRRAQDMTTASKEQMHGYELDQERSRAVYHLAAALSSTLDHNQILETVQTLGNIALREPDLDRRLVSVVFLFRSTDDQLHVTTGRRLTHADYRKGAPGRQGILAETISEGRPVFAGSAVEDPELKVFVGLRRAQSIVTVPLRASYQNYGVLVFGDEETDAFSPDTAELLSTIGTQATVALQNAVLYQNIFNEKERIVQVEEDARKKLARDLHDGPTQIVSAIAMRISIIQRMIRANQTDESIQELSKVADLANRTTKEIRHMLFALRPLVLESQGLVAAYGEIAKKTKDTFDLDVVVQAQPDIENYLEENAKGALFYIVEEAVNNARKYAEASQVTLRLYRRGPYCFVEVEDDGKGFDVKQIVNENYHKRGSLGMVNMRERAELVNGELNLQSEPGKGTKITIRIPIPEDLLHSARRRVLGANRQSQANVSLGETRLGAQVASGLDE